MESHLILLLFGVFSYIIDDHSCHIQGFCVYMFGNVDMVNVTAGLEGSLILLHFFGNFYKEVHSEHSLL